MGSKSPATGGSRPTLALFGITFRFATVFAETGSSALGWPWGANIGIQFAYSHSIRKVGPRAGLDAISLKRVRVLLGARSWVLLVAPGLLWLLLGELLGSSWVFVGAPGAPGIPWVLHGAPAGAYKSVAIDRRSNDPPKQSMLSLSTELERALVCWTPTLS